MADLAVLGLPAVPRIDGVGDGALARIREQARVQDQARRERWRIHELITPVEADKGLAALPEPSASDVFFDLEGDAFAADDGLKYLFGVADRDGGYGAQWALDQETEKRVFERFIDRVMARWQQHPGFHIYHYGAYETTAVKRLMPLRHPRRGGGPAAARGRVRRPAPRGPAGGPPRLGRALLDQEAGAVLRLHARGRADGRHAGPHPVRGDAGIRCRRRRG